MKQKFTSLRVRMLLPVIAMTLFVVALLTVLFSRAYTNMILQQERDENAAGFELVSRSVTPLIESSIAEVQSVLSDSRVASYARREYPTAAQLVHARISCRDYLRGELSRQEGIFGLLFMRQDGSLFGALPERKEFELFARMVPARDVGGDFYDFFLIDEDHLCLVIADVSGKGIPGALFMMLSKRIIEESARLELNAAEILEKTNRALCDNNQAGMFVTVWLGILEMSTGRLTAANAGHEYPAIQEHGGAFVLYKDKHGFVIGGMEEARYQAYELRLRPGDKIFVYTDGVPEATADSGEMFGTERMVTALNTGAEGSPEEILSAVKQAVDAFVGDAEQFDDLTMMCLTYKGAPSP